MSEVRETRLPGVGVRHEFDTEAGDRVGVVVHRDGRREIVTYDRVDPDACSSLLVLSSSDTRTMADLLGASQVTEAVTAMRHDIKGLSIEWIEVLASSPAAGISIGQGQYRARTGASIVAVLRDDQTVPAPEPDFVLEARDVAVAVGTSDGLAALRALLAR
ncbi:MAG: cation:proton antiporter regulatory subunit [Acidimicrobiales bacterium]